MVKFFARMTRQLASHWLREKYATGAMGIPHPFYDNLLQRCQVQYGDRWATKHVSPQFFNFIKTQVNELNQQRMNTIMADFERLYQENARIIEMTDEELIKLWENASHETLEVLGQDMQP